MRSYGVLTDRSGRTYLIYARNPRAAEPAAAVPDEAVPAATRRFVEWAVYALCGGAAVIAIWFIFLIPVAAPVAAPPPSHSPFQTISLNFLSELRSMSTDGVR